MVDWFFGGYFGFSFYLGDALGVGMCGWENLMCQMNSMSVFVNLYM